MIITKLPIVINQTFTRETYNNNGVIYVPNVNIHKNIKINKKKLNK